MEEITDIKELVLHYIRGIWKHRWIAIVVAWPIMLGGIVAVDQIPDRYTASTKVYIDSFSVLKPLLKGLTIQSDFQAMVRLMVNKLLSRPNLERAIRLMDMDINIQTERQMDTLISNVRNRVEITAQRRGSTYTIQYSDKDRLHAKKMVQTILDIFVEDTLGETVSESDSAIDFLDSQIDKYDQLLQEAEGRREEFKRKNVGLMPGDGANYYSQLQDNDNQLEQAKLSLEESINRRSKFKSQLDNLKETRETITTDAGTPSSLDTRIGVLETRLDDLLLLYTEQHPDVIHARFILSTLKTRREKELEAYQNNNDQSGMTTSDNPAYQEMLILLTQADADVSSFKTRVAALEKKQVKLKGLVDIVPRIEAEMQRLNRDYDVHQKNYSQLVQRREQAKISEDVESGTEQVKFRIIEPPFVPQKPQYPNRALFDTGVLVIALGIGYGIGLMISLFQPVFYNQVELASLGRAVLGTISKFDTPEVLAKRRRNLIMFSLVNILLVVVGSGLIFVHSKGILILSAIQLKVAVL